MMKSKAVIVAITMLLSIFVTAGMTTAVQEESTSKTSVDFHAASEPEITIKTNKLHYKVGETVKITFAQGCTLDNEIDPIPSSAFFCYLNGVKTQGLLGEYFNNIFLSGEPDMKRVDKDFNRLFLKGVVKDRGVCWFKRVVNRLNEGLSFFKWRKYPLGGSLVYGSVRKTFSSKAFSSKDFYNSGRDVSLKFLSLLNLPNIEINVDFLEGFFKRFWLNFFGTKVQASFSRRDEGKISGILRDEDCWLCSFIKRQGEGIGLCDWSAGAIHGIFEGLGFKVLQVFESECKSCEGKACVFNIEAEDLRILAEALPLPEPLKEHEPSKDEDKLPEIPSPVLPDPLEE